jgi:hypothetical protein
LLGLAATAQGDDTSALRHFAAGLRLAAAVRDVLNTGYFVRAIAEIALRHGHADAGKPVLAAAVLLLHTVGAPLHHWASARHTVGADPVPAAHGAAQGSQTTFSEQALTMDQAVAAACNLADSMLIQE